MLVPLIILAFYNHASAADDYCHIDTVFKYGWFGGMKAYYTGWSGRYFSIFLNHSNPLIFHWFAGFKWLPVFLYSGLLASFYLLIKKIDPNPGFLKDSGIASLLFYLLILKLPSILEAFFWTAAVVNYTVPNILTILWIWVAIRLRETDDPLNPSPSSRRYLMIFLMFFLVFAINGTSENNVFVIMILVAAWFGYELLFHKKFNWLYFSLLIWGVFTALLSFMSVGNKVRFEGNPESKNFVFAFIESFKYTPHLVWEWISNPPFIIITVLWICMLPQFLRSGTGRYNKYFNVNPFYSILVGAAVVISQIFPSYYGIGVNPTPRVVNCIYFFFLWAWFYNIGVVFLYLDRKNIISAGRIPSLPFAVKPFLLAVILWHFANSFNSRLMYRELLNGDAATYNREMTERTNLLMTSSADTLYLMPLSGHPQTLFLEDLTSNPEHLWNRCMAGYFGKKAIYLVEPRQHVTPE